MKTPTLRTLAIAIYVLGFPAALFIGETFGKGNRYGSKLDTILPMLLGLFSLAPFVMLVGWMTRIAPRASRVLLAIHAGVLALLLYPGTTKLAFLLPFPLLIAALYFSQRESRTGYEAWLRAKDFTPVSIPPGAVLDKLGPGSSWRCYANSFSLADGRTIPFLLWEGMGSASTMPAGGGGPLRTKFGLIAISVAGQEAGEGFIRELEALSLSKLTFWQRLKPSNQKRCPSLAERLPDGTFLVTWTLPHVATLLEERWQMLRGLLENSPRLPAQPIS